MEPVAFSPHMLAEFSQSLMLRLMIYINSFFKVQRCFSCEMLYISFLNLLEYVFV